ncbi:hypothetical protein [Spiroplasma endosymbiont of Crioceris asparagi]|uniref:hypothetical protein n=1 Tax=Spiroplasma endosymbiont of Crioceris asparagi TaxID=3066286 RepID=UPI0030D08791
MTLNDLIKINYDKSNLLETNPNFDNQLVEIMQYVDSLIFQNDIITKNICEFLNEQSFQINLSFNKTQNVSLTKLQIYNYLTNIKKTMARIIFKNQDYFNFYIFKEVFEITKYTYRKIKWSEEILDFEIQHKISSKEYHQQNETFKYLFSVFDKLSYIADHLYRKYLIKSNDDNQKEMLKFYQNFSHDINFLTKDKDAYNKLKNNIDSICFSSGWHLIRKLRNHIEHDFINPLAEHNIAFAIDLLMIYVLRIIILLKETLMSEEEIKLTLNKLKEKK